MLRLCRRKDCLFLKSGLKQSWWLYEQVAGDFRSKLCQGSGEGWILPGKRNVPYS